MGKNDGHINAGRISNSKRLQVILELLKKADHPMSAEEIAQQAYEFSRSGKIMLNVSTNIGEMRSSDNLSDGYVVSHAANWKSDRYPWHDGRPRYWLLAAPGWAPRWTIGAEGSLMYGGPGPSIAIYHGVEAAQRAATEAQTPADPPVKRFCQNDECGNEVTGDSLFCCDPCRVYSFKKIMSAAGGV